MATFLATSECLVGTIITGVRKELNFDEKFIRNAVAVYQSFTTTGNNNTLNLNDLDHHSSELILMFFYSPS